jgi:recombination protein RecR
MDTIDRLTRIFERFPGIGPRQANRFVQFLLRSSPALRHELAESVVALTKTAGECPECGRFHAAGRHKKCGLCIDATRDNTLLLIVAHDADIAAIERSNYHGRYFVLGNLLQLGSDSLEGIRFESLRQQLTYRPEIEELILALPANTEGDATSRRIVEACGQTFEGRALKISTLGRGLSTGSEIEYADPDTIANALKNRR